MLLGPEAIAVAVEPNSATWGPPQKLEAVEKMASGHRNGCCSLWSWSQFWLEPLGALKRRLPILGPHGRMEAPRRMSLAFLPPNRLWHGAKARIQLRSMMLAESALSLSNMVRSSLHYHVQLGAAPRSGTLTASANGCAKGRHRHAPFADGRLIQEVTALHRR